MGPTRFPLRLFFRLVAFPYSLGAEALAPRLLGATLCHRATPGAAMQRARIVEVEAYIGEHDLACHAAKGRTPRTEVLYGPPGRAYVYFVYGMHHLLNVVCAPEGEPQAVLLRAAEPLQNIATPTHGPARLTKAMGITTAAHNRLDLAGRRLWLEPGIPPEADDVVQTVRIGVDYAGAWADAPLRWYDGASDHVSKR